MKAKVTAPFDGAPDGELYPKRFEVGELVEGWLAGVAVGEGWAEELSEEEAAALASAGELTGDGTGEALPPIAADVVTEETVSPVGKKK